MDRESGRHNSANREKFTAKKSTSDLVPEHHTHEKSRQQYSSRLRSVLRLNVYPYPIQLISTFLFLSHRFTNRIFLPSTALRTIHQRNSTFKYSANYLPHAPMSDNMFNTPSPKSLQARYLPHLNTSSGSSLNGDEGYFSAASPVNHVK